MSKTKSFYWDVIEQYENTSRNYLNNPTTASSNKVKGVVASDKTNYSMASNQFLSGLHTAYNKHAKKT
jgi:hypothetical protein